MEIVNERTITHARFVLTIPNSWDLIEQYTRRVRVFYYIIGSPPFKEK